MSEQKKIPKKIHYCWLGQNDKTELVEKCIKSWKKFANEYEIIEWNEKNFDFENCGTYVKQAIKEKKWAFVTDYMRLKILYDEGGIYLDTDVELLKNFDAFLDNSSFMCKESFDTLCTAVIGSKKGEQWISDLLDIYNNRIFFKENGKIDFTPNSKYIFNYFNINSNLTHKNETQKLDGGLIVYCSEYFSPKNYSTMKIEITSQTVCIHHYGGMWKSKMSKLKDFILAIITRIIGEKNRSLLTYKLKK